MTAKATACVVLIGLISICVISAVPQQRAAAPTLSVDAATDEEVEHSSHTRHRRAGTLASFEFEEDAPTRRFAPPVCGIRRSSVPDVFTRIVGGTLAEKHEFPWQASMQWRYGWYSYHLCGATILNQHWVVTAAHCTTQFKTKDFIIVAGIHNVKHGDGSEQKRDVERVVEHWGYHHRTQENDIALMRVNKPFIIDGLTVSPVCLPDPDQTFTSSCVVSGWGKVTENGPNADQLRKVVVPIISKRQCKENYRVIGYNGPISEKMICAGYSQGSKDACQGDSGGPFVCRNRDNRYVLVGIVSWGVGCARPNVPGVYTEVSRYISWIQSATHERSLGTVNERAANTQASLHFDDLHTLRIQNDTFNFSNGLRLEDNVRQGEPLGQNNTPNSLFGAPDVVSIYAENVRNPNGHAQISEPTHMTVN